MNGVTQPTTPAGIKLRLDGNTLYMTQNIEENSSQIVARMNLKNDVKATAVIRLQKQ